MVRIRTILAPTDFSDAAETARQYAQDLAIQFKSRIHLLHVVSTPFVNDPWGTEALALRVADFVAQSAKSAREELAASVPKKGPLVGRVVTATANGPAVEQILAYAKKHRVDLIVMGTHGRGLAERWLLGSVAERVVRQSPIPVLTVHGRSSSTGRRSPGAK